MRETSWQARILRQDLARMEVIITQHGIQIFIVTQTTEGNNRQQQISTDKPVNNRQHKKSTDSKTKTRQQQTRRDENKKQQKNKRKQQRQQHIIINGSNEQHQVSSHSQISFLSLSSQFLCLFVRPHIPQSATGKINAYMGVRWSWGAHLEKPCCDFLLG